MNANVHISMTYNIRDLSIDQQWELQQKGIQTHQQPKVVTYGKANIVIQ